MLPIAKSGDFEPAPITNAVYCYSDVIINGEALPEPFTFKLQGEDNYPQYQYYIDPTSPDQAISYSAKAGVINPTDKAVYLLHMSDYPELQPGSVLNEQQLAVESVLREKTIVKGIITGTHQFRGIQLTWLTSRDELEKKWMETELVEYSQHSSIVMSEFSPSHAMAFDLAIGQCKAFDYQGGKFWEELLQRADWRDPMNGFGPAKEYYRTGQLPYQDTKRHMNKPDDILPKDVENDYGPREYPSTRSPKDIDMGRLPPGSSEMLTVKQWDMPKTLLDDELK
ncbi:hypothetical protein D3C75_783200 [compost metagenome]